MYTKWTTLYLLEYIKMTAFALHPYLTHLVIALPRIPPIYKEWPTKHHPYFPSSIFIPPWTEIQNVLPFFEPYPDIGSMADQPKRGLCSWSFWRTVGLKRGTQRSGFRFFNLYYAHLRWVKDSRWERGERIWYHYWWFIALVGCRRPAPGQRKGKGVVECFKS